MNKQRILYLYKQDSNFKLKETLVDELRILYEVIVYDSDQNYLMLLKQISVEVDLIDLVIIQNSKCLTFYKTLLKSLKRVPWIFVSCGNDINNHIAPEDSLYRIFNFGTVDLESWYIPREMQTFLRIPVSKKNYFKEKSEEENCRIVYYPNDYTIQNADRIIVYISDHYKNIDLVIVSDSHAILKSVLPPNVKVISPKASIAALRKAHVVLASGYDAVQAMAYAKPCIIIGSYGFGGMVTPENYEILRNYGFRGRAGASFNEMIPFELLNYEIQKSISPGKKEDCELVQRKIIIDYNYSIFKEILTTSINAAMSIASKIRSRKSMMLLKPLPTSIFGTEQVEGCMYLKRGNIFYGEADEELLNVFKQCDGETTIREILSAGEYDKYEVRIICDNLLELGRKKLIIFYE